MKELNFLFQKKDYCKIEDKKYICINVFYYENGLTYPVYVSDQKLRDSLDSLLISDENKSHYLYIKDFNRFMCNKARCKNKKIFLQMLLTMF